MLPAVKQFGVVIAAWVMSVLETGALVTLQASVCWHGFCQNELHVSSSQTDGQLHVRVGTADGRKPRGYGS